MELKTIIFIVVCILIVGIFIIFPEARSLFKGIVRVFIKDMATTPEGAEAIYSEKIDQAQESYNKADDALQKASGKLAMAKREMDNLQARLKKVESECESLVKSNKMDYAKLKAEEREEIISDIKRQTQIIKAYEDAEKAAKEAHQECEKRLRKLKRESKEVVENMKVQQITKDVYDDINDLKNVTGTDKMLDAVREKNSDLNAMTEGARIAHNNRASTKISKAEVEARKASSNDYLESLKSKYNK